MMKLLQSCFLDKVKRGWFFGFAALTAFLSYGLFFSHSRSLEEINAPIIQSFSAPLSFERNEGQTDPKVQFLCRAPNQIFYFTSNELTLSLHSKTDLSILKMQFVKANPDSFLLAANEQEHKSHYFIGNDPKNWHTNISNYAKVSYQNLYPGIDALFYGNQQEMEYDFCIAPGGNPNDIRIHFDGSNDLYLDEAGNLHIMTATNQEIKMLKPTVYQTTNSKKNTIEGNFLLLAQNEIGFKVAPYDLSQPLIIDPILSYSTYLRGNTGTQQGLGLAIDSSGNAYVTGTTDSSTFPTTAGAFRTTLPNANNSVFVTKFNATGTAQIYSTYLGGTNNENDGKAIVIDTSGNAYLTGFTQANNFPVTNGSTLQGTQDAFVTKLNSAGSALIYSTYLGGTGTETPGAIAIDSTGSAYVTGITTSTNFPVTAGAYQTTRNGTNDAYIAKYNPAGSSIVYATYLGGSGTEQSNGIAVDSSGNAYIVGTTFSSNFPTTAGAFQSTQPTGSFFNAFVTKLNSTGTGLVYSTYLGGTSSFGQGFGIAINSSGNAYVTGSTGATTFPTTSGAYQTTKPSASGNNSGHVTVFNPTGTGLVYSTYLSGTNNSTVGNSIAIDSGGNVFVTGQTTSATFPVTGNAVQSTLGSANGDAFISKLGSSLSSLIYSSFLGGSNVDTGNGVRLDSVGAAYLTGTTQSTNFPTTSGAFQTTLGSATSSAFVSKMNIATPFVTSISPTQGPDTGGTVVTITGQNFTGATAVNFGSNPASFTVDSDTQITAASPAGTGTVDVTVTTSFGTSPTSSADQFTYLPVPTVTGLSPNSGPESGGTSVTITGTNFTGATAVNFGASSATFTVDSDTQITATSPAGTGTVHVTVTNANGTSSTSSADEFTYIPAPAVTGLSPTSGPESGGTSVTITGTNFTGATAVNFGASSATFTVDSDTQITATSPAGTGTVHVTVTTPGGTSATSSADEFTYIPPPAVTGISPTSGPESGGTSVTITGTNFTGATAVNFGASSATFTVDSDTQITATSPAGTGTVHVTVTTPSGTSPTSSADEFTYIPPPAVTGISPTSGPESGGTSVTITGTNFTGATAVNFGASSATFTVDSDTQITATSPAGTGTVHVTVTTPSGTSPTSSADEFTYIPPPAVTGISPTSGPESGGTSVTITGTNFTGATAVNFGASSATFTVDSDTQITATSPAGTGTVHVTVTTPSGTSPTSSADEFTYIPPPAVTGISPTSGPESGGTSVTITGTNFTGATAVNFGASSATFTVDSDTQITATSPAGTGTVHVTVTTPSGTSPTSSADEFTYIPPPAVTGISPTSGPESGGTSVTITGTNFTGATAVNFGASSATFTVDSDTQITATSPAGTGTVHVTVTTPSGTSPTSSADEFTYIPPPAVTGISPTSGPESGGTSVTITGTNFTGATAVNFGASSATFTVDSDTQITATSPAGTGTVHVTVTTPSGTSPTSSADEFTYIPAPIVLGLSPNFGPASGGTIVTITGTNFTGATDVSFGDFSATFTVDSDTQITAVSPPEGAQISAILLGTGIVNVRVTTPNGTSEITPADRFTYIASPSAPRITNVSPTSGPEAGGTSVTITGENFIGAVQVRFGTASAVFFVNSDSSILAISPPGTGVVDITVTTPEGTSRITPADRFTYILPILPPTDLRGFQASNEFLTQTEYENVLSWRPPTRGLTPVAYRIYRDAALTRLVAVVPANKKLQFIDHNVIAGKAYTYYIVSESKEGDISEPAFVTVRPIN